VSGGAAVGGRNIGDLRVLLVHEWLYAWAGAERCLEQMLHIFPQADVLVGVVTPEMRDYNDVTRRAVETWVGKLPGARTYHRVFLPLHAAAFATHDTSGYDLIISSSHALEKFIRKSRNAVHVCYCYTPPRFLWDLRDVYAKHASLAGRAALAVGGPILRALDRRAARGVDRFVSISHHVAQRVERCYGVESDVVYPPVTAKPVGDLPARMEEPYLLTMGRLVEYKRVDLVMQAAERLRMRLVVAGDGPYRRKLETLAGPHTDFVGVVSEERAGALLDGCSAFVFGGEEDFGIAMVEANAHGRPVVCYSRGGTAETMIDGETAIFFEQASADSMATAIRTCLGRTWSTDRLRANAARYAPEVFRRDFSAIVMDALRARSGAVWPVAL
jgi:glycosyltransferase involved in cell wall biosynthesis